MKSSNVEKSRVYLSVFAIISCLLAAPAGAAEVSYADDDYSAGDTLTAEGLNEKFNSLKAGVNDNHGNTQINRAGIETNRNGVSTNNEAIKTNDGKISDNSKEIKANDKSIVEINKKIKARTTAEKPKAGDMQYWNGKAWVLVSAPKDKKAHSTLAFVNGKPVWKANYYKIGDRGPAGGFVFYVSDDGVHGLEAAPVDQSRGVPWGCYGTRISQGDDKGVGDGAKNSAEIMKGCKTDKIAARVADAYSLNGYEDWYLPSKDELNEMWLNLADPDGDGRNTGPDDAHNLASFGVESYWSSSEVAKSMAWVQSFFTGNQLGGNKNANHKDKKYRVRAIRAF